jgi:V8-like Glu-specific endopeptidase
MPVMKLAILITFSFLTLSNAFSASISIKPRVVYGIDDRKDVYESSDNLMKELSKSVAVQIMDTSVVAENDLYSIDKRTLADQGMCKSEPFADQPVAGHCSGFLIAPDVLVTAGHCVRDVTQCQSHYWIFDYANYTGVVPEFKFSKDQMYRCTEVISRVKEDGVGTDYAVVRLNRKVEGRTPLKIRTTGKMSDDALMTVIGFPSGLPLKITTGAEIRDNTKPNYFVMNSDTYGGNSGSAVVDTRTGLVEGILVRGDTDYQKSPTEDCYISVVRPQNGGRGEDATRITMIKLKSSKASSK